RISWGFWEPTSSRSSTRRSTTRAAIRAATAPLNQQQMGTGYLTQASNKRAITLNLKHEKGRAILKKLVKDADVLVENWRSGAFPALGLGWNDLRPLNPRLIYCSMTAFGQEGPRGVQTAYDQLIQATSGMMAMTGTPDVNPIKTGAPVIDYATGTMCAFAISAALFQRERTGRGQYIDSAMLDVSLMLMGSHITSYLRTGHEPKPKGNRMDRASSQRYQATDAPRMRAPCRWPRSSSPTAVRASRVRRLAWASTPTRCSRVWVTRTPRSRSCARKARSESRREGKRHDHSRWSQRPDGPISPSVDR